jgi:hypothetical protein
VIAVGKVVKTVASLLRANDPLSSYLAAIDQASIATLVSYLHPDMPVESYELRLNARSFVPDTVSPARPGSFVWDGETFVSLAEDDPRHADFQSYVHLSLIAIAAGGNRRDFANFVIPIPDGLPTSATPTTEAPSSGRLLALDEDDLLSATVTVRSPASDPSDFPVDLTDPSARRELLEMLNGCKRLSQRANGGLMPVSLEVKLVDGQECRILWFEDQPLELLTLTNSQVGGSKRLAVDSPALSAYLATYQADDM